MNKVGKPRKSIRRGYQTKRWRAIFFKKRPFEDSPFFEARQAIEGFEREGGPLDAFLEDAESSIPSYEATTILKFLRSNKARDFPARNQARARLDDREHGSGSCRDNEEWLTSDQLQDALSLQRFDSPGLSNADRRLIYIHRPDPDYLMALIETVYCHQAYALRDALWKYISYETSIRISMPLFATFVLEFHLAYLTLRSMALSTSTLEKPDDDQAAVTEFDVSFLMLDCAQHRGQKCSCKYVIQESQISVVISGWDNQNWVGWGLFNTSSDPTDDYDPDDQQILKEDYYAADGEEGPVVDADNPIWDPRRYWLCIIDIRVQLVLKEWIWLVRNVGAGVIAWKKHPILSAKAPKDGHHEDLRELFDWTIQTMQLLRQLKDRFERTTKAWTRFSAPDGDQCFFADMRDRATLLALERLKLSFQGFEDLQQELMSLDQSCKESQSILSLCLEHESNRVNADIQKMNYRTHTISLQTNTISREIQELNRQGTDAAIETVRAAQDTSRSTRSNVQVIWITTPLVLALQYFGVEKDIFPFERNSRSFVVALVILIFALPCLAYGLGYLSVLCSKLYMQLGWRPAAKRERKDRSNRLELQPQFTVISAA